MEAALFELERRSDVAFDALRRARTVAEQKLQTRRDILGALPHDSTSTIAYVGSIGRGEATAESDDDFILVVRDDPEHAAPDIDQIRQALGKLDDANLPSKDGPLGEPVRFEPMVRNIGLAADDNANTTRRMLFLLESTWATQQHIYVDHHREVLGRYIDRTVKPFRPPRFLLNDVVRYWRTMCVDFAGKEEADGSRKWGIRNAKLRTSRKILFAGGLLPILACAQLEHPKQMFAFLDEQFGLPPTDRIAQSFLENEALDPGVRTLKAYDRVIELFSDPEVRTELEGLVRDGASGSPAFQEIKRLGKEIEGGLLGLLFETERMPSLARSYGIF